MKRGVVVSDLHCGSFYGMLPPDFVTFEGVPKIPNPGQVYLWDCWLNFSNLVENFKPDFVIINGDCVDGRQAKSEGSELALSSWKDQRTACIETLKVMRSVTRNAKWYFTQGCYVPGTRVLTSSLEWVPVENLEEGERLLAFDEHGPYRRWKQGTVTGRGIKRKAVSEVTFSDGSKVVATNDHPWLCMPWVGCFAQHWRTTEELRPGKTRLNHIKPWTPVRDYETGWLAGIFDGEGCLHKDSGIVSFTQNEGLVLQRAQEHIRRLGFDTWITDKRPNDSTKVVTIAGGIAETMRFLGTVRPDRILPKTARINQCLKFRDEELTVVDVQPMGEQEIVAMSTSTGTYFAEGFGAHNTPYHVGNFGECEEDIAEAMDASPYESVGTGRLCREVLKLEVEPDFFLLAAHHVSLASVYTTTPLLKESRASKGKEQLHIRSHGHHCTEAMEDGIRTVMSPCWQLQTRYARKPGPQRLMPDLGGLFIEVDKGNSRVWPELYEHPAIPVSKL